MILCPKCGKHVPHITDINSVKHPAKHNSTGARICNGLVNFKDFTPFTPFPDRYIVRKARGKRLQHE